MQRVGIIINTRYGQTEKIAHRIRQRMLPFAAQVHVFSIAEPQDAIRIDLNEYDMVLIGAPVYAQEFSKPLEQWVRTFLAILRAKTCAFFTVSGNAGDPRPEARVADDAMIRKFLDQTGLTPQFVASFGGAIKYTKYNLLLRWMMKRISQKAGGSTDTSHDQELTDWDQVDSFVHALLDNDTRSIFSAAVRFKTAVTAETRITTKGPVTIT